MTIFHYKIVKRQKLNIWLEIGAVLVAILLSLLVSAGLIATSGANPWEAMQALAKGAFGNRNAVLETIVQATPLIFTGLAMVVSFRAKVFNIGAEGQFFAGAMAAAWISMNLAYFPKAAIIPLIILGSMAAGAVWGFIPGYLKARFGSNEIIVTVMLNYVIQFIISYLLGGAWRDPSQYFLQTIRFADSTHLPTFFDSRIHLGFFVSLLMVLLIYFLVWKTPLGYDIRAIGDNPTSSKYKGVRINLIMIAVMAISGAIAGLAGGMEVNGIHYRLKLDISTGYGFTGILIALLGRLNPFGVILAAVFFGALINGSTGMQIFTGVPVALVFSVQGIVLIFLLATEAITRYRLERLPNA
jgi:simple sugar transport system permease protein